MHLLRSNILVLVFCLTVLSGRAGGSEYALRDTTTIIADSVYIVPEKQLFDTVANMVNSLVDKRFRDPKAPRFLFVDQQNRLALGVGGYARMISGYEFNGIIPNDRDGGFSISSIPVPSKGYARNSYTLSFTSSLVYLNLVGNLEGIGPFSIYFSTTLNSDYLPKLDRGYMVFKGFTIGYVASAFADEESFAPQLDETLPGGAVGRSAVAIRYGYNTPRGWRFTLSTELPLIEATPATNIKVGAQAYPTVPAFIQYGWNRGKSHIRLSGVLRPMTYIDTVADHISTVLGWGVQLSGPLTLSRTVTFYFNAAYGQGIARYINDISKLAADIVPSYSNGSPMQVLPMYGVYLGAKVRLSPKVFTSFIYSQSRVYARNGYRPPEGFKFGREIVANLYWEANPYLLLGAEYLRGHKYVIEGKGGTANRLNLLAQFSF